MQAPGPPFAVMVLANAFAGFGMSLQVGGSTVLFIQILIALQNAQANGFIGSLKKHMTTKIGIFHGAYGNSMKA